MDQHKAEKRSQIYLAMQRQIIRGSEFCQLIKNKNNHGNPHKPPHQA
jgi:hypothetical protein